ncbi:MAG: hypothetical protein WAW96_13985, partial [Alphaproteobacteria bacterium]
MVDQSRDEPKGKRPTPQKASGAATPGGNGAAKDSNGIYVSPSGAKAGDAKAEAKPAAQGTKPAGDAGPKPASDYPLP